MAQRTALFAATAAACLLCSGWAPAASAQDLPVPQLTPPDPVQTPAMMARLQNGMSFSLPGGVYAGELPYALSLAGSDLQAFAATAASLSSNPALAAAVRQESVLRQSTGMRITALEQVVADRQRVVTVALYEVQKSARALSLAQRDAYVARAQLAAAHRQLAALDVNSRRLADTARLSDLQRALSLTESTLSPAAVLTETQRVVNAQLAASLHDMIAQTQARIDAAGVEIDSILGANVSAVAAERYRAAEASESEASEKWARAQSERAFADRSNTVRAHMLAAHAHEVINAAGLAALHKHTEAVAGGGGSGGSGATPSPAPGGAPAAAMAAPAAGGATAGGAAAAPAAAPAADAAAAAAPAFRAVRALVSGGAPAAAAPRFQQAGLGAEADAADAAGNGGAALHRAGELGGAAEGESLAARAAAAAGRVEHSALGGHVLRRRVGTASAPLPAAAAGGAGTGATAAAAVARSGGGSSEPVLDERYAQRQRQPHAERRGTTGGGRGGAASADSVARALADVAAVDSLVNGISQETRLHRDAGEPE